MSEFDHYSGDYAENVQRSIDFCGQELEFFTEVKVRLLGELIDRRLAPGRPIELLDVGCGVGMISRRLARKGRRVSGVDVSARSVERAREQLPEGDFRAYDGRALPFTDSSFDLAYAINVMHHVQPEARDALFAEMARVTRREGLVAILEHNPLNPLTRRAVSRCPFDEDAVLLGRREVRRRLRSAGLDPVESGFILFFPWRGGLWRGIERGLAWLPLGAQHLSAARRV